MRDIKTERKMIECFSPLTLECLTKLSTPSLNEHVEK